MSSEGRMEMFEPACPLCGGGEFRKLADNDRYGMELRTSGCAGCGLLQTWPRPTPAAMSAFYRESYRKTYQGISAADAQYAARFHKERRLSYSAELIGTHVGLGEGACVLDVGCAEGTLFAKLRERINGLELVGIEPFEEFARYARDTSGCATFPSLDALAASRPAGFDLIVVNHVLEHVDDPVCFLSGLRPFLSPAGRIYIDVPDADRYTSPESLHLAHLFHFSQGTLSAVVTAAGLAALAGERHTPPHHPPSVWMVAGADGNAGAVPTSPATEAHSWRAMRRLGRILPAYRVAARLYCTRPGQLFARLARTVRRRRS